MSLESWKKEFCLDEPVTCKTYKEAIDKTIYCYSAFLHHNLKKHGCKKSWGKGLSVTDGESCFSLNYFYCPICKTVINKQPYYGGFCKSCPVFICFKQSCFDDKSYYLLFAFGKIGIVSFLFKLKQLKELWAKRLEKKRLAKRLNNKELDKKLINLIEDQTNKEIEAYRIARVKSLERSGNRCLDSKNFK